MRHMNRHAKFGKLGTDRRQTTLHVTQTAQNPSEVQMSRKDDADTRRINEPAINNTHRAGRNIQLETNPAQLPEVPLVLHTQRDDLGLQVTELMDQLEELPILVFPGHPASLRAHDAGPAAARLPPSCADSDTGPTEDSAASTCGGSRAAAVTGGRGCC